MQENDPKCGFLTVLLQEVLQENIGYSCKSSNPYWRGRVGQMVFWEQSFKG
jgi:hypothetical protein